jgi:putative endonuclease
MRRITGQNGEDIAANYLIANGYKIIARNLSIGGGEIDIVATKKDCYIFIEVKTRHQHQLGSASEAITMNKAKRMAKAVYAYLKSRNLLDTCAQADVIAIELDNNEKPTIKHFENSIDLDAALANKRWQL